jgi:hypothetical protein
VFACPPFSQQSLRLWTCDISPSACRDISDSRFYLWCNHRIFHLKTHSQGVLLACCTCCRWWFHLWLSWSLPWIIRITSLILSALGQHQLEFGLEVSSNSEMTRLIIVARKSYHKIHSDESELVNASLNFSLRAYLERKIPHLTTKVNLLALHATFSWIPGRHNSLDWNFRNASSVCILLGSCEYKY